MISPARAERWRLYSGNYTVQMAARAKLFTPFFTTKERGLGLGLALCHRILEEHRGAIHITSEEGRGTTVTCFVPIAR